MYFCKNPRRPEGLAGWVLVFVFIAFPGFLKAAEQDEATKLFLKGNYSECIKVATKQIEDRTWEEDWPALLIKAQLAVGQYPEALATVTNALERYRSSITLRLLACEVFIDNGRTNNARSVIEDLNDLASSRMRYYRDPASLVALGRAALLLDVDPKLVLENFYDQARRADPKCRDADIASGELALDKHDYQLAAKVFTAALKNFPDDPDIQFGLARAYAPSDPEAMAKALDAVLDFNTNHVPALLLYADRLIDAEEYSEAEKILARALRVNPWQPEAWAYRAVLAHLRNDSSAEKAARQSALKYSRTDPKVDYLIGRKLGRKYRFKEASEYQQQALKYNPAFLPARIELAEDLLRLGKEKEGWELVSEVHRLDGYDVTAFNLVTLHDTLAKYKTITNEDFIVRMMPLEAELYGKDVLDLLQKAKDTLAKKYDLKLEQPTLVEVFGEQKDFAVRTFGVPHNPGYLGVCFGHVVTANSPSAQGGNPANWKAVLWHEFCHVITLGVTKNKMPRWLSEGISVYEERQANPTWGQGMTPRYRQMVLGEDFTPISDLSGAFLSPKSPVHMQFAYYESSLVVEFLVHDYGIDALKKILVDLGQGVEINEALARNTSPKEKLEKDFAEFAKARARSLGPGLDWEKPKLVAAFPGAPKEGDPVINEMESTNYWALQQKAEQFVRAKKWSEARAPLETLVKLCPEQTGQGSAYYPLARVYRELKEPKAEHETLEKLASLENDALDAYARLMEMDASAADWKSVKENAERYLAVNPMMALPYRQLARASEELKEPEKAIEAYEQMLMLDPPDPADVHYRLARLLRQQGDLPRAKRHLLKALEEAPRYRDAQKLLLELESNTSTRIDGLRSQEGRS